MTVHAITPADPDYPLSLKKMKRPPGLLYYLGASPKTLAERPCIAIIGTRRVSPYGQQVAQQFAHKLAEQGVVVVSGLAYGIDAIAHAAALDADGLTIAVLPSPVTQPYPADNSKLAERILEGGGSLVSEYESGPTYPSRFIARNRIVSGLADAILIVEGAEGSGTIHTAVSARKQQRPVLCIPGPITSPVSFIPNQLIATGQAKAVTTVDDVMKVLGARSTTKPKRVYRAKDPTEQKVLDLIKHGNASIDNLIEQGGFTIAHLNQVLSRLEQAGQIQYVHGLGWAIVHA